MTDYCPNQPWFAWYAGHLIEPGTTKNREGREFPFAVFPELGRGSSAGTIRASRAGDAECQRAI